jgi:hypothetical protein
MSRMSASETNAAPARTGSGFLQAEERDARAGVGVGGDLIANGTAVACPVAEHQVRLSGLIEAQGDLVGEQVADVEDFLARILQDDSAWRAESAAQDSRRLP